MSSKNKYTGRVAVIRSPGSEYISATIVARVYTVGQYSYEHLRFSAQANASEPDCFYGLSLDSSVRMTERDARSICALVSRIATLAAKQSAPRARLVNGQAYLDQCELAQLTAAFEKMGLCVRRVDTLADAHAWVEQVQADDTPPPCTIAPETPGETTH